MHDALEMQMQYLNIWNSLTWIKAIHVNKKADTSIEGLILITTKSEYFYTYLLPYKISISWYFVNNVLILYRKWKGDIEASLLQTVYVVASMKYVKLSLLLLL